MQKKRYSWNLNLLFRSVNDPDILVTRKKSYTASYKFINKWKDRSDYLHNVKLLKLALDEYNLWQKEFGANFKENYYFSLMEALDENNTKIKAKFNLSDEMAKKIQNDIQFFELRLAKIPKSKQQTFLRNSALKDYKNFLKRLFNQSKYLLTDPEEKIMNLKSSTSYDNWVRMMSGILSNEEAGIENENGKAESKNFSQIMGLMNNQNKRVRDSAAKSFNLILKKHIDVAENELNSILQNKKINDEIRGYLRPDKARHIGDDMETEVVDSLVKSVSKNFNIANRYYSLKANLFGVKKLKYHERNIEYGKIEKKYSFEQAIEIITSVTKNLDKDFYTIFENFINQGRIDVFPKRGKRSGAFCTYGLITHPVYILLNWSGLLNDVLTFAHELGHGINDELVKTKQNAINYGTPVSTAEVASTFLEDFVLQEILKKADDELKLALMLMKLNEDISSVFRQIAFYRFEQELHNNFREVGYLSKGEIGKLFQKHMISYMGPSIEQSEGSENWWVYINHFRYYFYVYSYASGLLISKALQWEVKKNPQFINNVKEFLSTGLSDSPKNIFMKLGINITKNNFWEKGITEISCLLQETENLAQRLNKI